MGLPADRNAAATVARTTKMSSARKGTSKRRKGSHVSAPKANAGKSTVSAIHSKKSVKISANALAAKIDHL
jgi:hypothetical protein